MKNNSMMQFDLSVSLSLLTEPPLFSGGAVAVINNPVMQFDLSFVLSVPTCTVLNLVEFELYACTCDKLKVPACASL